MNNIIGYMDYKCPCGNLEKIMNKAFFKVVVEQNKYGKIKILTNAHSLNEKKLNKISKKIKENGINKVVLSNKYLAQKDKFKEHGIDVLDGKFLMKSILKDTLKYIYQIKNVQTFDNELYVLVDNDKCADIIEDAASMFKCLNIVTTKIKKLKRLEKKLENTTDLVFSITNNKKKGLRRAKIIVNMDYSSDFFREARINRNAIIINLSHESLVLKSTFSGILVENVEIEYNQNPEEVELFDNFSKELVLESIILKEGYVNTRKILDKSNCKVTGLKGKNGEISKEEIKNNLS